MSHFFKVMGWLKDVRLFQSSMYRRDSFAAIHFQMAAEASHWSLWGLHYFDEADKLLLRYTVYNDFSRYYIFIAFFKVN